MRLDPADDTAYWRLLATLWREPGDLVIVEHDIGLHAGVIPGFGACPEPWCGHPYQLDRGIGVRAALGCTRFRGTLKAAEPDLLGVVGEASGGGIPAQSWRRIDVRLDGELTRRGYVMHVHPGTVKHYHRY